VLATLLSSDLPSLHVAELGLGELDTLRARLEHEHAPALARIVRGRRSRTRAAFFDEAAAALQLPSYFGAGWDAFVDCARDLAPGAQRVVMVSLASELFADEPAALAVLADVTTQLHSERPFHLLLQETPGGLRVLEARLRDAGLAFDRLELPMGHR
jgi:hypothetical protein